MVFHCVSNPKMSRRKTKTKAKPKPNPDTRLRPRLRPKFVIFYLSFVYGYFSFCRQFDITKGLSMVERDYRKRTSNDLHGMHWPCDPLISIDAQLMPLISIPSSQIPSKNHGNYVLTIINNFIYRLSVLSVTFVVYSIYIYTWIVHWECSIN